MKRNFIILLATTSLHLGIQAQGIPTIDVANLAQSIQQVLSWQQQYQQMLQQIEQMRQSNWTAINAFQSISGSRNLGSILNSITQSVIPPEFYSELKATTNLADVNNLINTQLQKINQSTSTRFTQIQQLMDAINATTDAKAIGELNARIQAEQAMIQNEAKEAVMLQQQHAQQINSIHANWQSTSIRANSQSIQATK